MSYVYFIQSTEPCRIKIGKAIDPKSRLANLQIGSPTTLLLLAYTPGNIGLESLFHHMFNQYRVRGEWYMPCPELRELIALIRSGEWESLTSDMHPDWLDPDDNKTWEWDMISGLTVSRRKKLNLPRHV